MKKTNSIFPFIINAAKPFKFFMGIHFFVIIYNAIDLSLWPYVSKLLVDKISVTPKDQVITEVWPLAVLFIILTILPGLIWRLSEFSWMHMIPKMRKKITEENMGHMMKHSHGFFLNNFSGALANRVKEMANLTPNILNTILYNFFSVALSLVIAFIALFSIHKYFAFGLVAWAGLFIFMSLKAARSTDKMSSDIADQGSKIVGNIVDVLGNINNVKLFSRPRYEIRRFNKLADKYTSLYQKRGWFLIKFYTIHGLTFSIYFVFSIAALIYLYSKNMVTIGDFIMLITINNYMIHIMWMAANEMRTFLEDAGTVKQAINVVYKKHDIKDGKNTLIVSGDKSGEISFDKVNFSYKNSKPIFVNKNVTIKAGQKVGLVGHSGGGKSTFINLILRLYDLKKGQIKIDGQDISKVTLESLRRSIGLIPQDPSLFHRSLLENIAYGRGVDSPVDENEIISASKKAHCHEFIFQMPKGYNSLVGERGVKLSGGQRQRISIARAFLKNAPILILDEATSQLDSITEELIQDSLYSLMENKTVLVIAHRLSTLQDMDRILVFDQGKIVEDGNHQELLKLNGKYKELWESQVGGFINDKK